MSSQVKRKLTTPWAAVAGWFAACVITIAGMIIGNEPEVILYRTAVGSAVISCLCVLLIQTIRQFCAIEDDDEF